MNILLLAPILFHLLLICSVHAQGINAKVALIDSIAKTIDTAKGLSVDSEDGIVRAKGKRHTIGSFFNEYFIDKYSLKLVKAIHGMTVKSNDYDVYYFHNDSLVLVTTNSWEPLKNHDTAFSSGHYYFKDDSLICQLEQNKFARYPKAYLEIAESDLKKYKMSERIFK